MLFVLPEICQEPCLYTEDNHGGQNAPLVRLFPSAAAAAFSFPID